MTKQELLLEIKEEISDYKNILLLKEDLSRFSNIISKNKVMKKIDNKLLNMVSAPWQLMFPGILLLGCVATVGCGTLLMILSLFMDFSLNIPLMILVASPYIFLCFEICFFVISGFILAIFRFVIDPIVALFERK